MSSVVFSETIIAPPDGKTDSHHRVEQQPRFHVVLWDDDNHTYFYVTRMLRELFGHPIERARELTLQVDKQGSAICLTTTREHAELKQDQVHAYGKDDMIAKCRGSMSCSIEPES